jgi:quercetin dioxygenase-like cupin family protein
VKGQKAQVIRPGDTVWIPADEVHWHGAAADSYLLHTAISLGGTNWLDEVSSDQFQDATT